MRRLSIDVFKDTLIENLIEKYGENSRRVAWFKELTREEHRPKYLIKVYNKLMRERS